MAFVEQRHSPESMAPLAVCALPKVLTALRFSRLDKRAKFSDIARHGLAAAFWRGHGEQQGISRRRDFSAKTPFRPRKAAVFACVVEARNQAMHNALNESTVTNPFLVSSIRIGNRTEIAAAKQRKLRILVSHVGI